MYKVDYTTRNIELNCAKLSIIFACNKPTAKDHTQL